METVQIVLLVITVFWFLFLIYLVNWFKKLLHNNYKEKTLFCCEVKKNTALGIFISCLVVFVVLIVVMVMAFTGAYTSTSSDSGSSTGNSLFYLHPNQKTILCPDAAFNSSGQVNGYTYTKRTLANLKDLIENVDFYDGRMNDIESTCTSGITSFFYLFGSSTIGRNNYQINLSSWDTSNVITMEGAFYNTSYSCKSKK
jgi:hypothetical protein